MLVDDGLIFLFTCLPTCVSLLFFQAHSPEDAEDGMQFMQEMIELSKLQQHERKSA
jgi:hypothetical protein